MHYLLKMMNETQEEYDNALEKHRQLASTSFVLKGVAGRRLDRGLLEFMMGLGKRRDVMHAEFAVKAVPLLKNIARKRKELGALKKMYELTDNELLSSKLPYAIIFKIAKFVPEKIELK